MYVVDGLIIYYLNNQGHRERHKSEPNSSKEL